ncbi:MAG: hypothetical protein F4X37_08300 [Acidimicrobiia bacterium]|nr:hypothetical protein [Acidimicrobiia bacterium]MYB25081.1 hypothetical protein [Acidimicrobiia bacterium]
MTSLGRRDEKAFNAYLGTALTECLRQSVVSAEQSMTRRPSGTTGRPDIYVETPGRERVLVENKFARKRATNQSGLRIQVEERFLERWADTDEPIRAIVGVLTPDEFATLPEPDVSDAVRTGRGFRWALWRTSTKDAFSRFPAEGWLEGSISALAAFIDRAGEDAADADAMADSVASCLRSAASEAAKAKHASMEFGAVLDQAPGEQTDRMAAAVMLNAALFQSHISANHAEDHPEVQSPSQMSARGEINQARVAEVWQAILDIDYYPVFGVALKLLHSVSDEEAARRMLEVLFRTAADVAGRSGAGSVVGRLFGTLIADRKFLATFYTRPASAALLAELAVSRLDVDWSDAAAVANLRVGDLACGTGALLNAVYRRITERHRVSGGSGGAIHRAMVEETMIGCDIMPAAVHLTAARLSGEHPEIGYTSTKTWVMPYGKTERFQHIEYRIGSLDLLGGNEIQVLWGDGTIAVTARDDLPQTSAHIPHESLNLAIMNPPFTRSTGQEAERVGISNPAFAGLDNEPEVQKLMSKAAAAVRRGLDWTPAAHGNAGIASYFLDLAHAKVKPGGVIALVLPASFVSGTSWASARRLLAVSYRDIEIWSIAQRAHRGSTGRAFSADTGMAEVLVLATRATEPESPPAASHVVLSDAPRSQLEAVEIAHSARAAERDGEIAVGRSNIGWRISTHFGPDAVGHPSGVSRFEVAQAASCLVRGRLRLPRLAGVAVELVPLSVLGARGIYHMDISGWNTDGTTRGPFDVVRLEDRNHHAASEWPVLWSHDHASEGRMQVLPCSEGRVRPDAGDSSGTGRGAKPMLKRAQDVWNGRPGIAGATRLHVNRDFRLNSQPAAACLTPSAALGGRAWPAFRPSPGGADLRETWEKALCVWLNSTLGLIGRWYVSNRQQQGRAILSVTAIGMIPVPDLRRIPSHRIVAAAKGFDDLADEAMLPANEAYRDGTRVMVDERTLCGLLGRPESELSHLAVLRQQWCAEPSVHGWKKTRP